MILNIYTDGACSGNQNKKNIGGWGAILEYGEHIKNLHGGEINTTNNRMEMIAVIEALQALNREGLAIRIFTDSAYVANCFKQNWYVNWRRNGWQTKNRKDVENKELWQKLLSLVKKHDVQFFKVRGHVNPDHPRTDIRKHYNAFCKDNGEEFSLDEFLHVTKRNNEADALANQGIDTLRIDKSR